MTLESSKTIGGIGALLLFIGFLPFAGLYSGLLGLIGLILVLIAMKGLADHYNDQGIFSNILYGVVTAIVGIVVFVALMVTVALDFLNKLNISTADLFDWTMFQQIPWQEVITPDFVMGYVLVVLIALIVLFAFAIITAIFFRRSLRSLSAKSKVGLFGTAGLLILIGAILTIIVIGFLLLWIALIILAIAFFSIPTQPTQQPSATPPPPQQ